MSAAIADQAMDLAERYGLRGYDAVHVAAAMDVQDARHTARASDVTLVSADISQLQAATAEGLSVEDPNAHP